MTTFENVSVEKQANVYFDGKVTSRTINFADGSHKTLGIMQIGLYQFSTHKAELMEILSGQVEVKINGENQWHLFQAGECFNIPANSGFEIHAIALTDYCCTFID
ncbi:pyrimidine/purine nucleoside phosphorylase [Thalassotalea marina]|uniref:Pyrimidine/purine nucleoside phosphorylase n=1 Tax=Thalassotalea marina TaxID=1673741 RepID=A0A919BGB4_9GAMM|nr:pyrimidine/purine nucleoside phosphorylase [Thalassotalea marina]GHF89062.1 UPF0345 protein [Thalassotalea marina]